VGRVIGRLLPSFKDQHSTPELAHLTEQGLTEEQPEEKKPNYPGILGEWLLELNLVTNAPLC
jgi:hypothetical protein